MAGACEGEMKEGKPIIPTGVPLPFTNRSRSLREAWTIAEWEFAQHPLVRAARYLMFRAELDIKVRIINEKTRFDKCKCGHERQKHLPNYGDPNYSNGICKYCKCMNFCEDNKNGNTKKRT